MQFSKEVHEEVDTDATITAQRDSAGVPISEETDTDGSNSTAPSPSDSTPNQDQANNDIISETITGAAPICVETKTVTQPMGLDVEDTETLPGPVLRVEEDGSVFIRGDSGYMKDRETIKAAINGGDEVTTTGHHHHHPSSKVTLSNKLLYSLD